MDYTTDELNKMSVPELRTIMRSMGMREKRTGSALKHECLYAITHGGEWPPEELDLDMAPAPAGTDLASVIAAAIAGKLPAQESLLDEERVREIIAESQNPNIIHVVRQDETVHDCGIQHYAFADFLAWVSDENVMLVGPAGSGKTYGAQVAAKALGLDFGMISCGPMTTKGDLIGYRDANHHYEPTLFRLAYENGGLFLLDEIDAAHGGVLTLLNAALDGGQCAFPDGMVQRHEDFRCVAGANTYGLGANRTYCGRNPLDGATRDRFVFIDWEYDHALETAYMGGDTEWTLRVRKIRAAIDVANVRVVASPRATRMGNDRLQRANPPTFEQLEKQLIWKGTDADTRAAVMAAIK